MDKKTKLKDLLKRLDSLEGSLPIGETKSYLDSLLEKGTKEFQKSFKEDPTVKYLDEFNGKLEKFKKDFNLEPIISEIESIQEQIAQMQESFTGQFDENTKTSELTKAELTSLIQSSKGELEGMTRKEISALLKKVSALEEELSFQDSNSKMQGQSLKQVISGYEKKIEDLTSKFKEMGMSHSAMMSGMDSKMEVQNVVIKEISADLDKFRKDFMSRLSNIGGGSMNQQVNINSSVMSTRYADINFKNSGGIAWSASDDNTNKRVNIVASVISGGGGAATNPAGNNTEIQFNDSGSFGASSTLAWNKNSSVLTVGNSTNSSIFSVNGPSSILQMTGGATISGNVGIGTTSPGAKLHVSNGHIITDNTYSLRSYGVGYLGATDSEFVSLSHEGAANTARITVDKTGSGSYRNLAFYTGGGEKVRIQTDGNVGIGTTNPGAKLEVGLQGSVAGTIRTAGASSGYVQIQPASVAGNWTLTLPPDDGSAGQILTTDGNGITTWTAAGAAGITRAVASTAVSSTIGGVASTDYVVFATAGVQLTLPTAVSNTNLYTIKNMSASSVLVATTAGQAIDGSATALLPTQYESLSFISNNSVWGVI